MGKNSKSRSEMVAKNVLWGYGNMLLTTALKFFCRWAFIRAIGETYLGINGLYTSILGVLSLTELGIGTAMNFSLYRPVAEQNIEKIKSLMRYYKMAYRLIALVIATLGVLLIPLLPYLVKGADGVDHLVLYYCLFLFNTVISYFVSYKYSLVNAEQKHYIINNLDTATAIVVNILQIVSLFVFRSFLIYLLIQSVGLLFSKIYISFYLNKRYPYLCEKDVQPLEETDKRSLFSNVKALVIHKLGDVAVNQTDNIIVSSAIGVAATGLISNYTLVISTVDSFLGIMFNSIIGSLGNLHATTDSEHQFRVYCSYDFVAFWLFGFAAIAYSSLLQPFTCLMWGEKFVVDFPVVLLIVINAYVAGQRIPLANMKTACGIFREDRLLPLLQAAINLVVSIVLAKLLGLIGVYIGTIISGIVPTFVRPIIVFRPMFDKSSWLYFKRFFLRFGLIALVGGINWLVTQSVMHTLSWLTFFLSVLITAVLPNLLLFILYRKTEEFVYLKNMGLQLLHKLKRT